MTANESAAGRERENVTLVVTGAARNVKSKDGLRHLHYGMTVGGYQYAFYAEPLPFRSVLSACGAFGSLKQDRYGKPLVYLRDTQITRRENIVYNSMSVLPDGVDNFEDLPDLHPWHDDND